LALGRIRVRACRRVRPESNGAEECMRRDLRHAGWFLAVLMPTAIALTLLTSTSTGARHAQRVATFASVHATHGEARETRRVERRETSEA
jgi:hypothetical protein